MRKHASEYTFYFFKISTLQTNLKILFIENRLIIGANNLTYRLWEGSVYYIEKGVHFSENTNFVDNFSKYKKYTTSSGVSSLCWSNRENFLIGTDEGFLL